MRTLVFGLTVMAVSTASARQVVVRQVPRPPPTTLAGLLELPGFGPTVPCGFAVPTIDTLTWWALSLPDTSEVMLPAGWIPRSLLNGDQGYIDVRLATSDDARISITRRRNGAQGRITLMYRSGAEPITQLCSVQKQEAGAAWAMYDPDPDIPDATRPFSAFGELITPAGRWYQVEVWARKSEDRNRVAGTLMEAFFRQRR